MNFLLEKLIEPSRNKHKRSHIWGERMRRRLKRSEDSIWIRGLKETRLLHAQQTSSWDEMPSTGGTLMWKISNFAQQRQDAVSGRRTSFYSSKFLYKSLWVQDVLTHLPEWWRNGQRNSYIAVFCADTQWVRRITPLAIQTEGHYDDIGSR